MFPLDLLLSVTKPRVSFSIADMLVFSNADFRFVCRVVGDDRFYVSSCSECRHTHTVYLLCNKR